MQTLQPNISVPAAMGISTIDIYHSIILSLTLALAGGHKVSAK